MPLPVGTPAPDFALADSAGATRSLAEIAAGGATLLAFFKTTCPTCSLAFPAYGEIERRYGDVVPVVAVSQSALDVAVPWLGELGFAGPVLDDESGGFAVSRAYAVHSVPTLVLVEDGLVVATSEAWDRDRVNQLAGELGARTGRDTSPVSTEGDGRPVFKPG